MFAPCAFRFLDFYTRVGVPELVAGVRIKRLTEEGQQFGNRPSSIPRTTVDSNRR
jgi:hypothetical protein